VDTDKSIDCPYGKGQAFLNSLTILIHFVKHLVALQKSSAAQEPLDSVMNRVVVYCPEITPSFNLSSRLSQNPLGIKSSSKAGKML